MKNINWKKKGPLALSCLILIAAMTTIDQVTKNMAAHSIPLDGRIEVIKGFFYLANVRNTGGAFSMGEGFGMWFFLIITVAALGAMVYYFLKTDDVRVQWCLALIAAGAIGNFIDRMTMGYVQDFFLFYLFGWPFPVFNVADICITCGFVLLICTMFWDEWKETRNGKNQISGTEH